MKRRWNYLPWVGFLVTLLAFLSYFFFFSQFPVTRDFPWVNLLLFAAGLGLLGVGVKRAFRQAQDYRGKISAPVLSLLSVAVLSLFLFYNFSLSRQLPSSEGAPRVGEKAPGFALPDKNGEPVTLSELLGLPEEAQSAQEGSGDWVLLVFYRGYW